MQRKGLRSQPVVSSYRTWPIGECFLFWVLSLSFVFSPHSGYQLAQPDVACRQETEELRLTSREPREGGCSGEAGPEEVVEELGAGKVCLAFDVC